MFLRSVAVTAISKQLAKGFTDTLAISTGHDHLIERHWALLPSEAETKE
jgi:hypothetical protein